jgi:hypothetical protein
VPGNLNRRIATRSRSATGEHIDVGKREKNWTLWQSLGKKVIGRIWRIQPKQQLHRTCAVLRKEHDVNTPLNR